MGFDYEDVKIVQEQLGVDRGLAADWLVWNNIALDAIKKKFQKVTNRDNAIQIDGKVELYVVVVNKEYLQMKVGLVGSDNELIEVTLPTTSMYIAFKTYIDLLILLVVILGLIHYKSDENKREV